MKLKFNFDHFIFYFGYKTSYLSLNKDLYTSFTIIQLLLLKITKIFFLVIKMDL